MACVTSSSHAPMSHPLNGPLVSAAEKASSLLLDVRQELSLPRVQHFEEDRAAYIQDPSARALARDKVQHLVPKRNEIVYPRKEL